jgi:hypothetical protein
MKYTVKMASGAMIYIPSFIKIGPSVHNFTAGDRISPLLFIYFKIRNVSQT